jgi:hypothetical protein
VTHPAIVRANNQIGLIGIARGIGDVGLSSRIRRANGRSRESQQNYERTKQVRASLTREVSLVFYCPMSTPNGTAKWRVRSRDSRYYDRGLELSSFFSGQNPRLFPTASPADRKQHLAH